MNTDEFRVMIADSSPVYKKMFAKAVTEVNNDASVACVADGDEALELIKRNDYDLIIIDAEIKGPGLLELLNGIMLEISKVHILVTGRPSPANERLFSDTLSSDAVECMTKPIYESYDKNHDIIKQRVAEIIRSLLEEKQNTRNIANTKPAAPGKKMQKKYFRPEIVLIAASTGGPSALKVVLSKLRGDCPVPILVVQHIPAYFTELLARDLNLKSRLRVKVAEDDESIAAGTVYLAPGGVHMKIDEKNIIYLDDSPPVNGVRPSADTLFTSVAESFSGKRVLAVILTGMGRDSQDGVARLKKMKECFCMTQSEKTCVVYGMPRAVVEAGLTDEVLDLETITNEIEAFFN